MKMKTAENVITLHIHTYSIMEKGFPPVPYPTRYTIMSNKAIKCVIYLLVICNC